MDKGSELDKIRNICTKNHMDHRAESLFYHLPSVANTGHRGKADKCVSGVMHRSHIRILDKLKSDKQEDSVREILLHRAIVAYQSDILYVFFTHYLLLDWAIV